MSHKLTEAAQALEAERLRPMPRSTQSADDAAQSAYLTSVLGEGGAARLKAFRALRRIVERLQREHGGLSFTDLVTRLLNNEANSRGWL